MGLAGASGSSNVYVNRNDAFLTIGSSGAPAVTVATLNLPPGKYLLAATVGVTSDSGYAYCFLNSASLGTINTSYFSNNSGANTFGWNGMTSGDTYLVEFWVNDGRNIGQSRSLTLSGGSDSSGFLSYGSDGSGPGQFITGQFVADLSGSETITVTPYSSGPNPSAQVNLFQVRDITVPEPSSLGILAAGAVLFVLRRKSSAT